MSEELLKAIEALGKQVKKEAARVQATTKEAKKLLGEVQQVASTTKEGEK